MCALFSEAPAYDCNLRETMVYLVKATQRSSTYNKWGLTVKKSSNQFQNLLYIAVGCSLAATLAVMFFNKQLFYVCAGITFLCAVLMLWQMRSIKRHINTFLFGLGQSLTTASKADVEAFPIPVFACADDGEILWCNSLAQIGVLEGENIYGKSIYSVINGSDITRSCPEGGYEVAYNGRNFAVYITPVEYDGDKLFLVYFFENTELKNYTREYFESRPSVMLILVDNYEELQQGLRDNERTRVMGQIEYTISKFVTDNGGLMLKTEREIGRAHV